MSRSYCKRIHLGGERRPRTNAVLRRCQYRGLMRYERAHLLYDDYLPPKSNLMHVWASYFGGYPQSFSRTWSEFLLQFTVGDRLYQLRRK